MGGERMFWRWLRGRMVCEGLEKEGKGEQRRRMEVEKEEEE